MINRKYQVPEVENLLLNIFLNNWTADSPIGRISRTLSWFDPLLGILSIVNKMADNQHGPLRFNIKENT